MKEEVEETKAQDGLTSGERLDRIIFRFFGKQNEFATKVNLTPSTVNRYISGVLKITRETAANMQELAGINADYLLNGEGDMMVDKSIKPIRPYSIKYQGEVPRTKVKQEHKAHIRGVTKLLLMESLGTLGREQLIDSGEVNVMDLVIDGIEAPTTIIITANKFRDRYNIKNIASMVIGDEYTDGNTVLAFDGKQFMLLEIDGEQMIDIADGKEVTDTESIDIIGAVFSLTTRF